MNLQASTVPAVKVIPSPPSLPALSALPVLPVLPAPAPSTAGAVMSGGSLRVPFMKLLVGGFVVLLVLATFMVATQYRKVRESAVAINANWPSNRCKPHIMPFAGWLVGPPGVSGLTNFVECGLLIFKSSFMSLMTPVYTFLDKMLNVILDLVRSVENIRKMVNYMRNSVQNFLLDIGGMLYGYGKKLSYLFNRLVKTFSLVFQTFDALFSTMGYAIFTTASIWNGPLGGVGRYFGCFLPSSMVRMADGSAKPISHLKLGDEVRSGGLVQALFEIEGHHVPLFEYVSKTGEVVFVSGDHLVQSASGSWVRVEDVSRQVSFRADRIWCLATEHGCVEIHGALFSDFQENVTDGQTEWIREQVLEELNGSHVQFSTAKAERLWALAGSTVIRTKAGPKRLQDIRLGDELDEGYVRGIVAVDPDGLTFFKVGDNVMSADIVVYHEEVWKPVSAIGRRLDGIDEKQVYHLLTSNNRIKLEDGRVITDFDQTLDSEANSEIDRVVETWLNRAVST